MPTLWKLRLFLVSYVFCKGNGLITEGKPSMWQMSIVSDGGAKSNMYDVEPGFDLTEDEMQKFHIWPAGVIPYYIDDFSYDKILRDKIRMFLENTNFVTGLHFMEIAKPPAGESERWVFFVNRQGRLDCVDHPFDNFTNEGVQKVVLGYNCWNSYRALAEVVLALVGVPPQHNSPNRDELVNILVENLLPDKEYLFIKLNNEDWLFHDVKYDFYSAGHYNLHKYSATGSATIQPKVSTIDINIGDGKGFSYEDIWKIRMLYNYISRRKSNKINFSRCDKLFVKGDINNNYNSESSDELKPRPKPNKYLLLEEMDTNYQNPQYDKTIQKYKDYSGSQDQNYSDDDYDNHNDNKISEDDEINDEYHNNDNGDDEDYNSNDEYENNYDDHDDKDDGDNDYDDEGYDNDNDNDDGDNEDYDNDKDDGDHEDYDNDKDYGDNEDYDNDQDDGDNVDYDNDNKAENENDYDEDNDHKIKLKDKQVTNKLNAELLDRKSTTISAFEESYLQLSDFETSEKMSLGLFTNAG